MEFKKNEEGKPNCSRIWKKKEKAMLPIILSQQLQQIFEVEERRGLTYNNNGVDTIVFLPYDFFQMFTLSTVFLMEIFSPFKIFEIQSCIYDYSEHRQYK